jgi:hypothetical protein
LMTQLERAIGAWNESKLTDADLGIELLRISNELATESKRLRAAEPATAGASAPSSRDAAEQLSTGVAPTGEETGAPQGRAEVTPSGGAEAECKCWHVVGKRIANRWCSLHASEWQTLAEQRSELHDDGTPRAGCGYCASTPELDARERGLR